MCWIIKLQDYTFEIVHKSTKKHLDADSSSRNPVSTSLIDNNDVEIPILMLSSHDS